MLRPNTHEDLQPVDPPRDCIRCYPAIAPGHTLVIAYDPEGVIAIEVRCPTKRVTPDLVSEILERARAWSLEDREKNTGPLLYVLP